MKITIKLEYQDGGKDIEYAMHVLVDDLREAEMGFEAMAKEVKNKIYKIVWHQKE